MNEKWDEIQGKLNLVRVGGGGGRGRGSASYPSSRYRGSALQVKVKNL